MSSRAGLNIFAKLQMQNTANTREEVRRVQLSLDNISENFAQMPAREKQMQNAFSSTINLVSTLQLLRYGMNDIKQIAEGKGGIGDILSLTTTATITIFRINEMLRDQTKLQIALNVARAAGLLLAGVSPVTLGVVGAGLVGAGLLYLSGANQKSLEPLYNDQRRKLQAYRSIVGN